MVFVGRERELARLAGALQRAAAGQPSRVVVTAPAGAGATRLLDELAERVAALPEVVLVRGTAVESATGEPYQALVEGLATTLASLSDVRLRMVVGRSAHDLVAVMPSLDARLQALDIDRSPPRLVAPDERGSRVLEALIGLIERLAATGVVLLVLEDLHWADPATRAFVAAMLRVRRHLPLCLLMSYRPEDLSRRHPWRPLALALEADPGTERLELAPLDADAEERLVTGIQGDHPASDLMAAIHVGAGGRPLMVRHLLSAARSVAGARLSDPFEDSVGALLDVLSPPARVLVRLLAAARQPLRRSLVAGMGLQGARITSASIAEAIDSDLVVARDERLAIAHELYAEAVESLELPEGRVQLHVAVAMLLDDQPARAAWHWTAAGRIREALDRHHRAAAIASVSDPGETTLFHHLRVLELTAALSTAPGSHGGPDDDPTAALLGAARAAAAMGAFRRAAGFLRRAIVAAAEARHGEDRETRRVATGALHEELGRVLWASGDLVGGISAMEHALAILPTTPSPQRARALATLAQHLMLDGRFAESADLATQARDAAEVVGPGARSELAHALCTLGVDVAWQGNLDQGLALLRASAAVARREGRLDDLMRAALNRTTLLDLDGRREQALEVVTVGIRDAESGGLGRTYGSFLRGNAADILFQLGRWSESEAECRAGMEWQPTGVAFFNPTLYLGLVLVESRADDEAEDLVGQTLLQLDTAPAGQWTALVQRAAVSLALWRGDHADALRVARREWPRVLETGDAGQIALAASTCLEAAAAAAEEGRSRRDVGLVSEATELVGAVLEEAERQVAVGSLPPNLGARVEADLHLAVARAHRRRVQGRPSAKAWSRLAEAWLDRGIPYQAAKARWWQALAELRRAGGDRSAAQDALHGAWRLASRLPAGPLCAELADLAVRARIPLPEDEGHQATLIRRRRAYRSGPARVAVPVVADVRVTEGGDDARGPIADIVRAPDKGGVPFGLSRRELEVLLIICEGRTDREIAERLFISERTVHVHVRKVLRKMGVASRTRASTLAWQAGIVPGVTGAAAGR
jgi:DNA-binding CsgD family transcriptional regulator/tetratricopeptide (TPR) repeat protein